jgi:hypothetical protein
VILLTGWDNGWSTTAKSRRTSITC